MALKRLRAIALSSIVVFAALPAYAQTEPSLTLTIDRFATLTGDGSIEFTVRVTCSLPGMEDVREGLAGATQPRTGAAAEGGLSPGISCDGETRTYTAGISLITESRFARGPAIARATVFACNVVDDQQVCVQESVQRRVIVRG